MFFDYSFKFGKQDVIASVITSIQPGSAAEKSTMEVGEAIVEINGEPV
jgi:membrane-associated protease RseP (regulator of RpoE activity)